MSGRAGIPATAEGFPHRRPDERIARFVAEALGGSRTVLDAGSVAGDLPFADGEFDAAMTLLGVDRWPDVRAGLREVRRVTRGPVVILTCDPDLVRDFWLYRYAPEVLDTEAQRHPTVEELASALGGSGTVRTVPIPLDCTGGFNEAYYGRPEAVLDPAARQACSAWSFVDLARELFGTAARPPGPIVRSGPHALLPHGPRTPDRVIGQDDVVVAELGSVLAVSEAGFASTLVLGEDPDRHRLARDLPRMFAACREALLADARLTGARLHAELLALAAGAGWTVGGWHCGHLVGADPAAGVREARPEAYLCPENDRPLRRTVEGGRQAHWVLEIHLADGTRGFGGSYKRLLDLV